MQGSFRVLIFVLSLLVIGAAACGGGDDDDDATGAEVSPTAEVTDADSETAPGGTHGPIETDDPEETSEPEDGGDTVDIDPQATCEIIPPPDMAEIVFATTVGFETIENPDGFTCDWLIEAEEGSGLPDGGAISVRFYTEGGPAAFEAVRSAHGADEIPSLGDEAFRTQAIDAVYVRVGDVVFFVQDATTRGDFAPPERWDIEVARRFANALR